MIAFSDFVLLVTLRATGSIIWSSILHQISFSKKRDFRQLIIIMLQGLQ
jgi:hypothetical protein